MSSLAVNLGETGYFGKIHHWRIAEEICTGSPFAVPVLTFLNTTMVQRYVRIQADSGTVHYGLFQLDHSVILLSDAPWLGGQALDIAIEEGNYQLLAPCQPSKIVAVGRNYRAHAAELGNEVPQEPLLFFKPPSAIAADQEAIVYPPQSQRVDYEGELAMVIGKKVKNISEEEAANAIWGYTIANDITARDLQRQDSQWTRAKGFDGFCPLGPGWCATSTWRPNCKPLLMMRNLPAKTVPLAT